MTLPEAVNATIAQLDRGSVESHVAHLVELQNQLAEATLATSEAAEAVRFKDKLNIFSKSKEEQARDAKEEVETRLQDAVAAKEDELHMMIKEAAPLSVVIQCMLEDLDRELSSAMYSTTKAHAKYAHVVEEGSAGGTQIVEEGSAEGAHVAEEESVKQLIASSVAACEAAHAALTPLVEQVGEPLSQDSLVQQTFEALVNGLRAES